MAAALAFASSASALQVDPGANTVVTVGFGAGATTSLPNEDLVLNGGRLTIAPSIGTGLTTTPGIVGNWINYGTTIINDTFATPWFLTPVATRTDLSLSTANFAGIDTVTGLPGAGVLPAGVGIAATTAFIDRYGANYNGLLTINEGGSYNFTMPSDDGAALFIDGTQVIANEGGHGIGTVGQGTVNLTAGLHQITVKYTNGGTGGGLQLAYQGPDQPVFPVIGTGITNIATVAVTALTNVTGGLNKAITNNITVPDQAFATATTLDTTGFDTVSSGVMSVGANGTLIFASGTSHSFTQTGPVLLGNNAGLSSSAQSVFFPISTTLTPGNVTITGPVILNGPANLDASTTGRLTINSVIDDAANSFGVTKNAGAGTVVLGGTTANLFEGAFNLGQGLLLLNKPAGVNAIGAGGLNLDTSFATGAAVIDYAVARLLANEQLPNTAPLNVVTNNFTGHGVTFDLNNFAETVGDLNVRGALSMGRVVTGLNGRLIVTGEITLTNNGSGGTGRETLITGVASASTALNLFQPGTGTLDLGGATRNVTVTTTVTQVNTDATIDSVIVNGGINKLGDQRLVLNGSNPGTGRASTFAGGITLTDGVLRGGGMGGQRDTAFGTGAITILKGLTTLAGGIPAGQATVELRNNAPGVNTAQGGTVGGISIGQAVANTVTFGNAVTIDSTVPVAGFDVNNYVQLQNGATLTGSGATMVMGTLTTTAPTQINVTGGSNNYGLRFNGFALGGPLTVSPTTANLQLNNLGTAGANSITTSLATGNLIIGGNGAGYSGTINLAGGGTLRLAPAIGVVNNLLGTGTVTGGNTGSVLGISPTTEGGSVSGVGAIQGGLAAKFYQTNAAQVINTSSAYYLVPSGTTTVSIVSEGSITNRPPVVTGTSFTNDIMVMSGLLKIDNAGDYRFQTFVDDESQLVIDGIPMVSVNVGAGGTGIIHSPVSAPINLSAGFHTITMKVSNQGGAGGFGIFYSGLDSGGVMRTLPSSALYRPAPFTNVANSGVNQTIAGATFTLDGGGTDLDGGINDLTFTGAGTLAVTNGASSVTAPNGTGVITVSGTTSYGANNITISPTTAAVGLLGDVTGTGSISKTGTGLLILAGPKTFSGALNITAGGVQVTNAASLGTAAGATVITAGAVLDLNGVALGAEPLTLNGTGVANVTPASLWNSQATPASHSGTINLASNTAVSGLGDVTLSGVISGTGTLQKAGPNTLTLSGSNTFGTALTVSVGVLKIGNPAALGTAAGNTVVSAGAVLDLNGFSISEPLNVNGAGFTNFGTSNALAAIINSSATPVTLSGTMTLAGATAIGSSSLAPGGDITVSGIISGSQTLTKTGGNTVTLTADNSHTGTTVNYGTLTLNAGGLINDGAATVNPTATLNFDNTATNVAGRLGAARALNIVGGNFNLIGNSSIATVEALTSGAITINSGNGVVTVTPPAGLGTTLSSTAALIRTNNGTALFRGANLGIAPGANVGTILLGSIPAVGQQGAAGSKNRAIIPWALADQSATGSGLSFAGHVGVNGIQVLNVVTDYDVDTVTGPNNVLITGVSPFTGPGGNTLVNSVSLSGGSLNLGAGDVWQVDSGGLLASTTGQISGGQLNAGIAQSNNLREWVVMTPGTGTNLTIATPLVTNVPGVNAAGPGVTPNVMSRLGLTKAGNGTLTLGAQNTFVGTTRLNAGTTMLAGGDNTILFPTTAAPVAGSAASTLNVGNLVVNAGAILDLNGTNQRFGGYASNFAAGTTALPGQGGVITNNSTTADATIYFTQGATFVVPSSLNASTQAGAKKLNLQRDGGFTITMTAPNTYTGTTVLNGGVLALQDGATLSGTSSITINRAVLRMDDSQFIATPNRIPVTTPITLNGGALDFVGRGGGTQNVMSLGTVTIGLGGALLQGDMPANANANGAGDLKVSIGNLARGGVGSQVFFDFIQRNNQNMGDNPRFFLGQLNGGALPAPGVMLPAWITVGGYNPASLAGGTSGAINNITQNTSDFAQYDPNTGLRPVTYTSTFAPGNNVNVGSTQTIPSGGAVVNSLRMEGASTLIFNNAGYDTLNLQSGGLLSAFNNNANNKVIALAANGGNITAGGVNPGAPQELYIYNSAQTLTVNARIINNPTDGSVVNPVFSGNSLGGTITLTGSNTYTGTAYVNGVNLILNNTVGSVAIPGNLIASGGTSNGTDSQNPASQTISLNASNQIAATATVTLNGGTQLNLNNNSNTLANLILAADGGSFNNQGPTVLTGTGTLTLNGGVTATTLNQATTIPSLQGNLALPIGPHTFNVGTFTAAPGQVGLALNSALIGAGEISKVGPGILGIGGTSTAFTGTINVTSGGLQITTNNASIGAGSISLNGNTLNAGGLVGTVGSISGTGTVTSTFAAAPSTGGRINVGADNNNSSFGGLVTGVVAMGKVGTGTFTLTNPANDFTGGTLVMNGILALAGAGLNTTGNGGITVNGGGTLAGAGVISGTLQFNPNSAANFAVTTPGGAAPIVMSGTSSVNSSGPATFNVSGATVPGTYPLIDYSGSPIPASRLAGIKLANAPAGGLLFGLVNNAANTSIDLSAEPVKPSQTWTGAASGVWDTTSNNWSGTYANGNQAIFTDAATNRSITGPEVSPQAITVTNSATTNFQSTTYSIANPVAGALAGGLIKNGGGILQLTGANTFTGPIQVNGGTLRAAVSTAANSLGSASVTLASGATLQLDPVANTSTPGITGRYFHQQSNANFLGAMHFQLPAVATQTDVTSGVFNITWTSANRPAGGNVGFSTGGAWESFGAQFVGKLNITAAGPYSIYSSSDDATRVFIDGVQINNNDGGKGVMEAGYTANLDIGLHDVRLEFLQGTGGAQARLGWQGPGIAKADIPATSLFAAENVAGGFADNNIQVGTNLTVTGNSTLKLNGSNFTAVQMGGLTMGGGSTLTVIGKAGKQLRASSTSLGGGIATIDASADLNLGVISDGGTPTTLIKKGPGRLFMDNTSPLNTGLANVLSPGSSLEIQGGTLIARGINAAALPIAGTNPLGSASINLNGGNLSLETKQNAVTFDNSIIVSKSATIEQQAAATIALTLGGTNGIAVNGPATLTFDLFGGTRGTTNPGLQNANQLSAGANLIVAGPISGTGDVVFRSTQTNQGQYAVYGSATLNANNTINGTVTLNGGFAFQNVTNPLVVTLNGQGRLSSSTGLILNAAQLTVDDSATVNTNRLTFGVPVTLRAGTLSILASTGANSGETIGTLTADAGWNRVSMLNTPGATFTGTLQADALTRNNRSAVQFQGITLGGAAVAADLVRFNTAPALVGGGGAAGTALLSIIPYAVGSANPATNPPVFMPVTIDVNGVRPLNTTTEITTLGNAVANGNARSSIGAATTTPGPTSVGTLINSWVLDNSAATAQILTLDTNVLNFSGGAGLILVTASNATQSALTIAAGAPGNGINFGTSEGHIIVTNTAGVTIGTVISGSNGLTISGNNNINTNTLGQQSGGSVTLTNANTFTGPVTINGRLVINNGTTDTPLGADANPVQFGGGTLVFGSANSTIAATRTVTMLANSFGVLDTNGNSNTISGPVTGAGGLVKIGAGTLLLSNAANNYSGATTIFQGNLITNTGPQGNISVQGTAIATGGNNTVVSNVTFTQGTSGTYTGNITGIGSVTFNGTSATNITITLGDPNDATKGVNQYGGGTTFANSNPVTLAGTTSSLVGGIVTQTNNAIVYNQNFDGTAGSVISGPASLTKNGTGVVSLVNANSYTGATNVLGGTLAITAAANLGAASNTLTIANGSTLRASGSFDLGLARTMSIGAGGARVDVPEVSDNLTISGGINGIAADSFTKTGFGRVTFAGLNSYAGITNVDGGTLALGPGATMTSSAGVNVASGANLDVTAAGGLDVLNGKFLAVNGVVTGPVTLGGALSGAGVVNGTLDVITGATVSPGNSAGDLTITGQTTFDPGSAFTVELNGSVAGTGYDQLTIGSTGAMIINGGTLSLSLNFAPAFGQTFMLIENLSAAPILGEFSNLADNGKIVATFGAAQYEFTADYQGGTGNDLVLTVPEPGSALLLIGGLGSLVAMRRRRQG